MAAEDVCFDEELLFTEFEAEKGTKKTVEEKNDCPGKKSWKTLQQENMRLKNALKSLISMWKLNCGTRADEQDRYSPLFQGIYFDNRTSIRTRAKVEEFVQTLQRRTDDFNERESFGSQNFPPSIFETNYEVGKLAENSGCSVPFSVVSSLQYYDEYCIDCCGLPLVDFNPQISDGWTIPQYTQVYFTVLTPEETPRVKLKSRSCCFNCGNPGHSLKDCPEARDLEKINANRREFCNKFASPLNLKTRYHFDDSAVKRFGIFKPGVISDKLREALGISEQDIPPYIYRMRHLGYPPGYLPKEAKPSLLIYDGDGSISDYIEKDEHENGDHIRSSFIEYPGFNIPLPEGARDRSAELGAPPMQLHQQIDNLVAKYMHMRGLASNTGAPSQDNKKRKREELDRDEQDMEVDEDGGANASLELGSAVSPLKPAAAKRTKYDDIHEDVGLDNGSGYSPSHPGVQYGAQERELLQRFRKHSGSKSTPCASDQRHTEGSCLANNGEPRKIRRKVRRSVEEGEVVSDEEGEIVDEDENEEDEAEEEAVDDYPEVTPGWWLREPLDFVSTTQPKLSPPPKPSVQLPLDALSRFYTNSTVLQKMSFEDRVMWLDPIYGNLQPVSGRYDRLRKLLGKKNTGK